MAEMKEILIANLTLDTTRRNNIPPLIVPQGDYGARVIRAVITEHGKPVTVESTAAVSIVAERSGDGVAQAFSGNVNEDGSVSVPVTQWMLDVPENDVKCHIVVTGSGYQYSTTSFLIEPQAKANPTEISEDDPRVDVVTEVLAGEKDRVQAEFQRRVNETARKNAEEDRQSAEDQRLTDEATRVSNEAERVSSELSRDATFKGWAQDIASLPSFDSRISANSDRITNIEAGLPSSVWHVDNTAARIKDVPENARPKAIVNKIGGMTYKTVNLIPFPYYDPSRTLNGVTITVGEKGGFTLNGKTTADSGFSFIANANNNVNGIFTLSAATSGSVSGGNPYLQPYIDGTAQAATNLTATRIYNLKGNLNQLSMFWKTGTVFTNFVVYPMLNEGSTAKPYSPYFEGLRSAKVTAVKSVGVNLMSVNRASLQREGTIFDVAPSPPLEAGKYTISFKASNYESGSSVSFNCLDANGHFIADGATGLEETSSITINADKRVYRVFLYTNSSIGVEAKDIMLNKGSIVRPYTPYVEHTLPIPEELRPANGINAEVYDSIELNENGSVTKRDKCGEVDLGTLTWRLSADNIFYASKPWDMNSSYKCIISNKYSVNTTGDNSIWFGSSINVRDNTYTDAESFKAAMSGVMLVYELAEPEVTDYYADFIIDVEGGGTMTFEDEHGYDMPNTVTYMLKEATA